MGRFDLVAAELLETLVADSEMVSDLVQHYPPDLAPQALPIGAVQALERPAVDRDLVRQDTAVTAAPSRQRNALIQPEQRLPGRRLPFDDDRDVRDDVSKVARKRGHCVLDLPLEVNLTVNGHMSSVARARAALRRRSEQRQGFCSPVQAYALSGLVAY